MAKPLLYTTSAFDATHEHMFRFMYAGIITGVKAMIYSVNNGQPIYMSEVYVTQKAEYVLPANAISNSTQMYRIRLCVVDNNGADSTWSDDRYFYCKATPKFAFAGLTSVNHIQTSSLEVQVEYASTDSERLQEYTIYLYDGSQSEIQHSTAFYSAGVSYIVSNLVNDNTENGAGKTYYIRAQGITENGMKLDTGMVCITVGYENNGDYAKVIATNQPDAGAISIRSFIVSIDGALIGNCESKDVDGTIVPGVSNGSYIIYDQGLRLCGDFYIGMRIPEVSKLNSTVVELNAGNDRCEIMVVKRIVEGTTRVYAILNTGRYTTQSNYLSDEANIGMKIIRKNGIYGVMLENI